MCITISFIDWLASSAKKDKLIIRISEPVTTLELYRRAEEQVGIYGFSKELENFMISYKGELLNHEAALEKVLIPGDEILLVPIISGG